MKRIAVSTLVAISTSLVMITTVQPAFAMQNIKCIKNGAAEQLSAWKREAGGLSDTIRSGKTDTKRLIPALQGLRKDGDRLVTACKTCGAEDYAKAVGELSAMLGKHIETVSVDGKLSEDLLGTLEKIANLEG